MKALNDLQIFVDVARLSSLSAAARERDMTPAAISAAMKRLEAELGCALFVRSTRRLRLSRQGEEFLPVCQQAITALSSGIADLQQNQAKLSGLLQISMPSDCGRHLFLDWLDDFQVQHPDIQLRVHLSDNLADIYGQPVDIAIRYGQPQDSSLIALPLLKNNYRVLCASPEYLARHGTPKHPKQLSEHNCLSYGLGGSPHNHWWFKHQERSYEITVKGDRLASDGEAVRRWALAGKGIAYKSVLDVADDLKHSRLVRACPEWRGEDAPLNLLFTDRQHNKHSAQTLRTFLVEKLERHLTSS
ncbi:LysR family transcriptional regulator [Paraferrimonas sedimenticola]|uniref:Transcriptional regulator n=1 Tax=Paraferrimonas sedimenticola TaxID=375674 RepID=A0AA37RZQ6_9GAMM|nr:LysR family transcriptional regulator [Paraferrimonas sedimenticola]GLP97642.1 transcriptional regulator [Paraferrimonas sedimenticola]